MSRHSSFPAITLAVCLLLLVCATTFAQSENQATTPVDVLYLVTNNTIQTYNVDPSYGNATLYGTLTVPAPSNSYPVFVPGANDHYIYVWCMCGTEGTDLQVYATDSNGAPQAPPIQAVEFKTTFWNFVIDPNGTLAYATQPLQNSSQESEYGIRAFALSPRTGILTVLPSLSAVEYPPAGEFCSQSNPFSDPIFSLNGFNLNGTQLIDDWRCSGYDDWTGYYYTRTVDRQTGALGPDVATVGTSSSEDEYSTVTFTPTSILSFQGEGFEGGTSGLSVYWPNATLDFSCDATTFDACIYSGGIAADRTGKFVFFYTDAGATEVARLNMAKQTFEAVGIPLADVINSFSLDDKLIYGWRTSSSNGNYVIPVYVFDPSTGLVTDNGITITMPNVLTTLVPALRY
jgi:hypothetical protein